MPTPGLPPQSGLLLDAGLSARGPKAVGNAAGARSGAFSTKAAPATRVVHAGKKERHASARSFWRRTPKIPKSRPEAWVTGSAGLSGSWSSWPSGWMNLITRYQIAPSRNPKRAVLRYHALLSPLALLHRQCTLTMNLSKRIIRPLGVFHLSRIKVFQRYGLSELYFSDGIVD